MMRLRFACWYWSRIVHLRRPAVAAGGTLAARLAPRVNDLRRREPAQGGSGTTDERCRGGIAAGARWQLWRASGVEVARRDRGLRRVARPRAARRRADPRAGCRARAARRPDAQ